MEIRRELPEFKARSEPAFPSIEDLERADFENLNEMWGKNDERLLEILGRNKLPYFGFHGASHNGIEHAKGLKTNDGEEQLQMTTFFDIPEDRRLLLDTLYENARYASSYAFSKMNRDNFDSPGGVVVMNTDSAEGNRNMASGHRNIHPRETMGMRGFAKTVGEEGWRVVTKDNYDNTVAGIIEGDEFAWYADFADRKADLFHAETDGDRKSMLQRQIHVAEHFQAQRVLYEALKILRVDDQLQFTKAA